MWAAASNRRRLRAHIDIFALSVRARQWNPRLLGRRTRVCVFPPQLYTIRAGIRKSPGFMARKLERVPNSQNSEGDSQTGRSRIHLAGWKGGQHEWQCSVRRIYGNASSMSRKSCQTFSVPPCSNSLNLSCILNVQMVSCDRVARWCWRCGRIAPESPAIQQRAASTSVQATDHAHATVLDNARLPAAKV
jgi:hypothetical protein